MEIVLYLGANIKMIERVKESDIVLLKEGIDSFGLKLTDEQIKMSLDYINILLKWNKFYSLTSINNVSGIIVNHLLDAFVITPYLGIYDSILDIGSGIGIPGIILAIYFTKKQIVLVDINKKKTAFLQQVVIELKLNNVKIINNDIEQHLLKEKYGCKTMAISRAFTNADKFIKFFIDTDITDLMLMKSIKVEEELKNIDKFKYDIIQLNNFKSDKIRYLLKIMLN